MQFLVTITLAQVSGAPPDELQAAMTALIATETRRGIFVITGGLPTLLLSLDVSVPMAGAASWGGLGNQRIGRRNV